ncbi:MAG: ribosome maturation factor RimP [Pseudomonadales bacterium]
MVAIVQQLQGLIEPLVGTLGYQLWGLEFSAHGKRKLLRVFIDGPQGISVDDCATTSRQISSVLDVEDPISGEYMLEVSSPGMDRPLFSVRQFEQYIGHVVKVKLATPFDGRRHYKGVLSQVDNDEARVVVADFEYSLPMELIEKANVVPQYE